jgi:hypothetical protein
MMRKTRYPVKFTGAASSNRQRHDVKKTPVLLTDTPALYTLLEADRLLMPKQHNTIKIKCQVPDSKVPEGNRKPLKALKIRAGREQAGLLQIINILST